MSVCFILIIAAADTLRFVIDQVNLPSVNLHYKQNNLCPDR